MLRALGFTLLQILSVQACQDDMLDQKALTEQRNRASVIIYENIKNPEKQQEGIEIYKKLIDRNEEFAAKNLAVHIMCGDIYPNMRDEERDLEVANVLFQGVEKGNAHAIFELATFNKKHDYKFISGPKIVGYLITASQQGNDNARCFLSQLYRDKKFCEQWQIPYDPLQAVKILHQSFMNNSAVGAVFLAEMYLSGELGERDVIQAYKYLKPFILQGDNRARVMWENVKKTTTYPNFVTLLEKQFDKKDGNANYYMAKGYLKGRYGLKKDLELAERYLMEGITKEDPIKSLYLLAKMYGDVHSFLYNPYRRERLIDQLLHHPTRTARYYALKLTENNSARFILENMKRGEDRRELCAHYFCGRLWAGMDKRPEGKRFSISKSISYRYLKKALAQSYAPAFRFVAEIYTFGYFGKIDHESAQEFLKKAVEKCDDYKAKVMLSNYSRLKRSSDYIQHMKNPQRDNVEKLREILLTYN